MTYGVPDLELYDFLINAEPVGAEFDANRHLMLLLELVVHYALHEAGLAHARISNDNQLEEVILRRQRPVRQHLKGNVLDLFHLALFHSALSSLSALNPSLSYSDYCPRRQSN